jgi:carbon storage regulator
MLVLSRGINERIMIGNSIVVTVIQIQGGKVRIGIEAPPEVAIAREELLSGLDRADGRLAAVGDRGNR